MKSALATLALTVSAFGQASTCGGLTSVSDTVEPRYPAIAKAAHVDGLVILLVAFKTSGEVNQVDLLSGPKLLQQSAKNYVSGWRINSYTGPRTCPIILRFVLQEYGQKQVPPFTRIDPQHVIINFGIPLMLPSPQY